MQTAGAGVKAGVALLLTLAAGFVDIVGFLSVYHAFTAQMTGNTVHLGHWLAQRNWSGAGMTAATVAAFVLGSIVGRVVIEIASRRRMRSVASVTLALEVLLIAGFIFIVTGASGAHPEPLLIAMLAAAMGVQTATLTRVGPLTIHTTFLTGMLNKLAQMMAHAVFHTYDLLRTRLKDERGAHRDLQHEALRQGSFLFAVWLCYLAGAVTGSFFEARWEIRALYLPVALLLAGIAIDQWKPLSVESERDQPER
jgi:uncharacterized membrane protein YoaK (UPF0700 family)